MGYLPYQLVHDFFHQQYYLTRPYFWERYVGGGRLTSHDHQLFYDTYSFEGIYPYLEDHPQELILIPPGVAVVPLAEMAELHGWTNWSF